MFWKLVKNIIRIGIPVAAIKVTYDQGVWDGSTIKSSQLYERVKKFIVPGSIVYPEQLPTPEEVTNTATNTWNYGVQSVFQGVESLPHLACDTITKIKSKLS